MGGVVRRLSLSRSQTPFGNALVECNSIADSSSNQQKLARNGISRVQETLPSETWERGTTIRDGSIPSLTYFKIIWRGCPKIPREQRDEPNLDRIEARTTSIPVAVCKERATKSSVQIRRSPSRAGAFLACGSVARSLQNIPVMLLARLLAASQKSSRRCHGEFSDSLQVKR